MALRLILILHQSTHLTVQFLTFIRPEHKFDNSQLHERTALAEMLNTKIITPSKDEVLENPRSRSARMRVLRKLSEPRL